MCGLTIIGRERAGRTAHAGGYRSGRATKKWNFWATRDNLSEPQVVFSLYATIRVLPGDQSFGRNTCNRIQVVCPVRTGLREIRKGHPQFRGNTSSRPKGEPGCGGSL